MKIKTFNSVVDVFDVVSESTLDNDVNKWIKEIDPIIADIKYSISGNKHYGAISTILIRILFNQEYGMVRKEDLFTFKILHMD